MKRLGWVALVVPLAGAASAEISYLESGYGVTFEGCDYDKVINLQNGYVWACEEYGYLYHYGSLTVLQVNGTSKLCVGSVEEAMSQFPNGNCYRGTLYRW